MTKKRRIITCLLVTAAISGLVLTGCTTTQAETKTTGTASSSSTQTAAATDTATFGKVTAVSGTTVTLALGTMNQTDGGTPPDQNQTAPTNDGSAPPEKPAGSTDTAQGSTDTTASATQTAPAGGQGGSMPDMLTLTGATTSITLSDAITLTKMSGHQPDQQTSTTTTDATATTADIKVGSILKITYGSDGTTIQAIEIMTVPQAQ